jgi:cell division protein FtsZ
MGSLELTETHLLLAGAAAASAVLLIALLRFMRPGNRRRVRIVAVGSGGAKSAEAMIRGGMRGVEFVAVDTDARALKRSSIRKKIKIGRDITNGLGAGGDLKVGEAAAREASEMIARTLTGADMVVVVAGLGGGTGSGAAPVVTEISRQQGALTMAVVTRPFGFEGRGRQWAADAAVQEFPGKVDAVATFPNDRVFDLVSPDVSVEDAFRTIDQAVFTSVQEILNLVAVPGRIDLDFADLKAVLAGGGSAVIGLGRASGEDRALDAARQAIASARPDGGMERATSVLLHVAGSRQLKLAELIAVTDEIRAAVHPQANVSFGMAINRRLRKSVQVTVIATGFETASGSSTILSADAESAPWRPAWLRDRSAPKPVPAQPAAISPEEEAEPVAPDRPPVKYRRRSRRSSVPSEAV